MKNALSLALFAVLSCAGTASADEVRLLSAAAMQTVFKQIAGDFERGSGHRLVIAYGTIGGITQRVLEGESADVVIGSTLSMPALVQNGRIRRGSQVVLCKTGIGLVVPTGTPVPRMASPEDFKAAMIGARVVVFADPVRGGAAGIHVGRVLRELGIAGRLKSQIALAAGGDVTEVTLAQGPCALGVTQISEIVGKPGAEYVGPMPDELQNYTVFVAGTPAKARSPEAVTSFIQFMKSPVAAAAIRARGMEVE